MKCLLYYIHRVHFSRGITSRDLIACVLHNPLHSLLMCFLSLGLSRPFSSVDSTLSLFLFFSFFNCASASPGLSPKTAKVSCLEDPLVLMISGPWADLAPWPLGPWDGLLGVDTYFRPSPQEDHPQDPFLSASLDLLAAQVACPHIQRDSQIVLVEWLAVDLQEEQVEAVCWLPLFVPDEVVVPLVLVLLSHVVRLSVVVRLLALLAERRGAVHAVLRLDDGRLFPARRRRQMTCRMPRPLQELLG